MKLPKWLHANRIAIGLVFITGLLATLAPVVASVSWQTSASAIVSVGAVAAAVLKFLDGWQFNEKREAIIAHPELREEATVGAYVLPLEAAKGTATTPLVRTAETTPHESREVVVRTCRADSSAGLESALCAGDYLIDAFDVTVDACDQPNVLPDSADEDRYARSFCEDATVGHVLSSPHDRYTARRLACEAAVLLLRNATATHYTEGSKRWEGIARGLRALRGQFPAMADCSSAISWYLWTATRAWHLPDFANGQNWERGYTGTLANHGNKVTNGHYLLADVALYGDPFGATGHAALLVGERNGRPVVISDGSEEGPFLLDLRYRPDLLEVRRLIT